MRHSLIALWVTQINMLLFVRLTVRPDSCVKVFNVFIIILAKSTSTLEKIMTSSAKHKCVRPVLTHLQWNLNHGFLELCLIRPMNISIIVTNRNGEKGLPCRRLLNVGKKHASFSLNETKSSAEVMHAITLLIVHSEKPSSWKTARRKLHSTKSKTFLMSILRVHHGGPFFDW